MSVLEPLDPLKDAEADQWEFVDPFPEIAPALLTAEQIFNYAQVTSFIVPFSKENIKGATYQVGMAGNVYYWDDKKKRRTPSVSGIPSGEIELKANSITFVETEVEFLLPQYIAIRFNLHIKLVHRGLLLGTGPIVDPGFRGKLLIPLHNLTSSPYTIGKDEKIIWVEFTKTAFGQKSKNPRYVDLDPKFGCFPVGKRRISSGEYLWKANANNPIMSSLSGVFADVENRVSSIESKYEKWQFYSFAALFITVLLAVGSVASFFWTAMSTINANNAQQRSTDNRVEILEECLKMPSPAECLKSETN